MVAYGKQILARHDRISIEAPYKYDRNLKIKQLQLKDSGVYDCTGSQGSIKQFNLRFPSGNLYTFLIDYLLWHCGCVATVHVGGVYRAPIYTIPECPCCV